MRPRPMPSNSRSASCRENPSPSLLRQSRRYWVLGWRSRRTLWCTHHIPLQSKLQGSFSVHREMRERKRREKKKCKIELYIFKFVHLKRYIEYIFKYFALFPLDRSNCARSRFTEARKELMSYLSLFFFWFFFWSSRESTLIRANFAQRSLPFGHSDFCGSTNSALASWKRELVFDKSVSSHQVH